VSVRQWPGFLCVHNSPIMNVKNQVKDDLRNTPLRLSLVGVRESQRLVNNSVSNKLHNDSIT
jgi:hypothetical protein